ncbi:YDL176W [Saccharomyces arboricola H-6]|uniref:YDL176W n=1 Tax=Saccharomyces arboricola (strain H-6 / AS 2.3317 / CBS 10644) TaxID=1160507 RepID=J8QA06_SACAR|nr:YDL176W [Saccharomyces arboricola H-6]
MATGRIQFAVSTPCNSKGKPSGYRLFEYKNDQLTLIPTERGCTKIDVNANIQAFCYLRPNGRDTAISSDTSHIMDSCDYMILAKSNGFIEIISNYQYKIKNGMRLAPSYVLRCTPEDFESNFFSDYMIAGLEYSQGLLYCCMCSGRIYVFIMNLPADYIQFKNIFNPIFPDCFFKVRNENNVSESSEEEKIFEGTTRYTGRSCSKHICYFLLPIEPSHLRSSPVVSSFCNMYQGLPIYRPSMYLHIERGISTFHINPLDRFCFMTVSPRSPLFIRKIILPLTYVTFLSTFMSLKNSIQGNKRDEVLSWDSIAQQNGFGSLFNWISNKFTFDSDIINSTIWDDIVKYSGTGMLDSGIVWKQRQGHAKDDIYELFHTQDMLSSSRRNSSLNAASNEPRPLSRRRRESFQGLTRDVFRETMDVPCSAKWELDSFIRGLRRNTFMVDFEIVEKISHRNANDGMDQDDTNTDESNETMTSFLTDNYKKMDIVCIDHFVTLSAFRPRYYDEPILKIDSLSNKNGSGHATNGKKGEKQPDNNEQMINDEATQFQQALGDLCSFKKLFMLNDSFCFILDTHGVLLINRFEIKNTKNLLKNPKGTVRIIPHDFGLINDAIVVVNDIGMNANNICSLMFHLVITSMAGDIAVFNGEFFNHSRLGTLRLCDSLKLNRKDRFVDKLALIDYDCPSTQKRRLGYEEKDFYAFIVKKVKKD